MAMYISRAAPALLGLLALWISLDSPAAPVGAATALPGDCPADYSPPEGYRCKLGRFTDHY
jgi:hypothetical protein